MAVTGLNGAPAVRAGAAATAGVKMKVLAARPSSSVRGRREMGVALWAAAMEGRSEKYVTRYVGR